MVVLGAVADVAVGIDEEKVVLSIEVMAVETTVVNSV